MRALDPQAKLLFVCSRNALDRGIYQRAGEPFRQLFSGKLRRYFSILNITDCFLLGIGFVQSVWIISRFHPDIIFSKGGYVSVPMAFAARLFGIPLIIHESDSVQGLANRIIARHAVKVLTSYPSKTGEFLGMPVRKEIFAGDAVRGTAFLNFTNTKPIVFGFGGSQGSKRMNDALLAGLKKIIPQANIVWVTGSTAHGDIDGSDVRFFQFLHDEFPHVLAAADLVVGRSGSSIFELAAAGKPMLLIPHPHTGGDHQRKNAEIFVEHGAAEMLLDSELTGDLLADKIIDLLNHPDRRAQLANAAKALFRPDAAKRIAREIMVVARTHQHATGSAQN